MSHPKNFASVGAVLAYLTGEAGRKLKQAKLYKDIRSGALRRDKDGTFKPRDVDRYATTLPLVEGLPAKDADKAAQSALKRAEALATKEHESALMMRRKREILEGKYLPRDLVSQLLAARAVVLEQSIMSLVHVEAATLIRVSSGDLEKTADFARAFAGLLAPLFTEYAQTGDFEVTIDVSGDLAAFADEEAHPQKEEEEPYEP